jgi:hypothetical protein
MLQEAPVYKKPPGPKDTGGQTGFSRAGILSCIRKMLMRKISHQHQYQFSCFLACFNHVVNGHPCAVIAALSGVSVLLDESQITVAPAVLLAAVQGKPIRNRKYFQKKRNANCNNKLNIE